ncbi:unnamed protein product [Cochlearia groenlandica]
MEKAASSTVTDLSCVTALNSPPPPLSPQSDQSNGKQHQEEFAANFASLYNSIFSPESQFPISLSPSPPSSSSSPLDEDAAATENRLRQARLILEYDELNEHYEICVSRLRSITTEVDCLRRENDSLRLENIDLLKLIHISASSSSSSSFSSVSPPNFRNRKQISDFGSQISVYDHLRNETIKNRERDSLPKSISVRSQGYLKPSHGRVSANRQTSQLNHTSQLGSESVSEKVCERDETEEVYHRQGTMKTELCNKWQETGDCPYGDNCQFAHGVGELRPVIRHPRYKTQICKMILAGDTCPYGHRCHFRHSLTDQERRTMMMMLLSR